MKKLNIFIPPVTTNADRIRNMTDEELVQFIRKPFCDRRTHDECKMSYCGVCDCCILDWLQEPAKEDSNADR